MLTSPQATYGPAAGRDVRRQALACIGLVACLLGVWAAGRAGLARLLSDYAMENGLPGLADGAVRLSPSDPQAHYARALALSRAGRPADALEEFGSAVALRPGDYVLWMELGKARGQSGDLEGALVAFREAARLAPYYARPRWETGQLLLGAGRRDEAFEEFRLAVARRPALLPEVIDLAWETFGGDAQAVQGAVRPQTGHERLVLARFIAQHGATDEAMQLFRAAGEIPDEDRRSFLNELLAGKRFREAHEVWSSRREVSAGGRGGDIGAITDGGFEGRITRNDPGFGWQVASHAQAVSVSLDADQPRAGAQSLLLSFGGDARPSDRILTQLVPVAPRARYRLSFAARSQELVTGGPPFVAVTDASDSGGRELARALPLPSGTSGWRDYTLEFATKDATGAVLIAIGRQSCSTGDPCPIFGRVWFDAFDLQRLS